MIMLLRIFFVFSCLSLFVVPLNYAHAQTGEQELSEEQQKAKDLAKAQADALQERINGVMNELDQGEMTHFMVIYTNYNLYSVVKAVREDVKNAVGGCAKNNPAMADDLNNRYSRWEGSVGSSMKEVDDNIQSMALAQDYVSQNELKTIFSMIDEMRAMNSSQFEKTPVTTPEACEFMMSKMDETQENMIRLLSGTLQSYPNMLRKTQK